MDKLRAIKLLQSSTVLTTLTEFPFCCHKHQLLFKGLLLQSKQKSEKQTNTCISHKISIVQLCTGISYMYLKQMKEVNPLPTNLSLYHFFFYYNVYLYTIIKYFIIIIILKCLRTVLILKSTKNKKANTYVPAICN